MESPNRLIRAFVPRRVERNKVRELINRLYYHNCIGSIAGVATTAPIKQEGILGNALIIDVTYNAAVERDSNHGDLSMKTLSFLLPKSPKTRGYELGWSKGYEGFVSQSRKEAKDEARFVSVLIPPPEMDTFSKNNFHSLYQSLKNGALRGYISFGKFPLPEREYRIDAWMVVFESREAHAEEKVKYELWEMFDRFAYSVESPIFIF